MRALLDPISDFHGAKAPTPSQPFHDHMRPFEAREAFRKMEWDYSSYYRFVFIRNPWARLASLYAMILGLDRSMRLPFTEWLETTSPYGEGGGGAQAWRRYGTYSLSAFAGDGSGTLFVDDVFRLEDIESVPEKLRQRGVPLPPGATLPHVNRTLGTADYRAIYATKRSVEFVRENYANEIRRFHYRFPPP